MIVSGESEFEVIYQVNQSRGLLFHLLKQLGIGESMARRSGSVHEYIEIKQVIVNAVAQRLEDILSKLFHEGALHIALHCDCEARAFHKFRQRSAHGVDQYLFLGIGGNIGVPRFQELVVVKRRSARSRCCSRGSGGTLRVELSCTVA